MLQPHFLALLLLVAPPATGDEAYLDALIAEAEANALAAGARDDGYVDDVEAREALVQGPLVLIRRGEVEAALRLFERDLELAQRRGASAEEQARLLTAFALTLDHEDVTDKSTPYFRRVIDATRAAYGTLHTDTAYALTDYGIVVSRSEDIRSYQLAEAALMEAYEIRRELFGDTAPDTAASLRYLAARRGHPILTQGDPARIEAANELFELATRAEPYDDAWTIYSEWALMFGRNGLPERACNVLTRASQDADRLYLTVPMLAEAIASDLELEGHHAHADAIRAGASGRAGRVGGPASSCAAIAAQAVGRRL